jgi:hypothetical protein
VTVSKRTIVQLFVGAALALVVGIVVGLVALLIAIASRVIAIGGADVVTVHGDALAGMLVWLVVASLLIGGGTFVAIAAWVGALFNTMKLEDKTWFVLLLVLGLASFGWVAMIAYLLAGPDGTRQGSARDEISASTAHG